MAQYGFNPNSTWNMFEAGHGKGADDAIGGVVKHMADQHVNKGNDITSAKQLYEVLSEQATKVNIFFIEKT